MIGPLGPGVKNVRWPNPNPYAPGPETAFYDPNLERMMKMMSPCPTGGKAIPGQFSSAAALIGLLGGPAAVNAAGGEVLDAIDALPPDWTSGNKAVDFWINAIQIERELVKKLFQKRPAK